MVTGMKPATVRSPCDLDWYILLFQNDGLAMQKVVVLAGLLWLVCCEKPLCMKVWCRLPVRGAGYQ